MANGQSNSMWEEDNYLYLGVKVLADNLSSSSSPHLLLSGCPDHESPVGLIRTPRYLSYFVITGTQYTANAIRTSLSVHMLTSTHLLGNNTELEPSLGKRYHC